MRIGLDLDDVILEHTKQLIAFNNAEYEEKLEWDNFHTFGLYNVLPITEEEAKKRLARFYETSFYKDMPLVEGALRGIIELNNNGHECSIISNRPSNHDKITIELLDLYFPENSFRNRILLGTHSLPHTDNRFHENIGSNENRLPYVNKAGICSGINIDIMIEDDYAQAINCALMGVMTLLFDAPWNRRAYNNSIPATIRNRLYKVFSWNDILLYVNGFNNEIIQLPKDDRILF